MKIKSMVTFMVVFVPVITPSSGSRGEGGRGEGAGGGEFGAG